MKKLCLLVAFLLAPSLLWAQSVMTVSNVTGPVEIFSASGKAFVNVSASVRDVKVGDRIRTGEGGYLTLHMADGSYLNVTPNSTVVIQDNWNSGLRGIANILAGKVRFYIEKLGGQPNPIRVNTPTALIAVRGTIFDVAMDPATHWTEVTCIDGQVGVTATGRDDREVVLQPGLKTLVVPGQPPLRPIAQAEAFPNRQFRITPVNPADDVDRIMKGLNLPSVAGRDNDRGGRPQPGGGGSSPTLVDPRVERAKPGTLSYPNE